MIIVNLCLDDYIICMLSGMLLNESLLVKIMR